MLSGHSFVMLHYRHNRPPKSVNVIVFSSSPQSVRHRHFQILIRILGVRSIGKIGWLKVQKRDFTDIFKKIDTMVSVIFSTREIMVNNVKGLNSYLGQKSFLRQEAGRRFVLNLIFNTTLHPNSPLKICGI